MRFLPLSAGLMLALSTTVLQAADPDQAIRETLKTIQPDLPIETISESAMPGVFQVQLKGGRLLYASADGSRRTALHRHAPHTTACTQVQDYPASRIQMNILSLRRNSQTRVSSRHTA